MSDEPDKMFSTIFVVLDWSLASAILAGRFLLYECAAGKHQSCLSAHFIEALRAKLFLAVSFHVFRVANFFSAQAAF